MEGGGSNAISRHAKVSSKGLQIVDGWMVNDLYIHECAIGPRAASEKFPGSGSRFSRSRRIA